MMFQICMKFPKTLVLYCKMDTCLYRIRGHLCQMLRKLRAFIASRHNLYQRYHQIALQIEGILSVEERKNSMRLNVV